MTHEETQKLHQYACQHLTGGAEIHRRTAETSVDAIVESARLIVECFQAGRKVLICGNGGSAADAQHMAAEFVNRLDKDCERPGLPAIALTTDTSFLTAHSNDYGFDSVFERQVLALGKPRDVLIAISTSGNSKNVTRAVTAASQTGLSTIGLMGEGGVLTTLVDVPIIIASRNTQYVQESSLAVEHAICLLTEHALYPDRPATSNPTG